MNTEQLLEDLQAKYPKHEFIADTPENVGMTISFDGEELKERGVPEKVIAFTYQGICVWDPSASTCSRFMAKPRDYKLKAADVKAILEHNKASIHG